MIEVGTPEVKTVYWIGNIKRKLDEELTLNCESIGSKRD